MSDEDHNEDCPLTEVHRRMDDAHRLWHQALDSYFDPDAFRVALQSCIQALRTVTFLLQYQKRRIPDFDAWYGDIRIGVSFNVDDRAEVTGVTLDYYGEFRREP